MADTYAQNVERASNAIKEYKERQVSEDAGIENAILSKDAMAENAYQEKWASVEKVGGELLGTQLGLRGLYKAGTKGLSKYREYKKSQKPEEDTTEDGNLGDEGSEVVDDINPFSEGGKSLSSAFTSSKAVPEATAEATQGTTTFTEAEDTVNLANPFGEAGGAVADAGGAVADAGSSLIGGATKVAGQVAGKVADVGSKIGDTVADTVAKTAEEGGEIGGDALGSVVSKLAGAGADELGATIGSAVLDAVPVVGEVSLIVGGIVSIGEAIYHAFHPLKPAPPSVKIFATAPQALTQKMAQGVPSYDSSVSADHGGGFTAF